MSIKNFLTSVKVLIILTLTFEVALTDLGEIATRELAKKHRPYGLEENKKVANMGGHAAKVARDDIEKNLGESVITRKNALNYKYIDSNKLDNETSRRRSDSVCNNRRVIQFPNCKCK